MNQCVAVVGSGSAGRRHAIALRRALPDAELVVVQRVGSSQPGAVLVEVEARIVHTLDAALAREPGVAVVANPAPFHRHAADSLLAGGAHVLVEKPLADDVGAAQAIVRAAQAGERELVVGYHLRYGDTVPHLKQLLDRGMIGEPTSFHLAVGQHLDQWRPGTDPRRSVSARRDLGGGVLLELSHELDGIRYLLGAVAEVSAQLEHDGAPTDGQVETVAELDVRTHTGVSGHVHLDMVSPVPSRRWELQGTSGRLLADLLSGRIEHENDAGNTRVVATFAVGERDRAEERLIANLIATAAGAAAPLCSGADGVAAVAIVQAAMTSARSGRPAVIPPA